MSTFDCTRSSPTHASVKKPTPAAPHTLAWNHLHRGSSAATENAIESYENLAESAFASAARRRSSKKSPASAGRPINLSSPDSCS